jgi:hypothetical protein
MQLPRDVVGLVIEALAVKQKHAWKRMHDGKERNKAYCEQKDVMLVQASAIINVSLVCKQWSTVTLLPERWQQLWHDLSPYARRQQCSWQCYRAQVYCEVRDSQLSLAIRAFIKQEKLVYRSPRAKRRYDAAQLGMRKLIKLGKDKLWSHKKEQFMALSREWKRIHQRAIDIDNALLRRKLADQK